MWGIYGNATLTYNRQNLPLQHTSGGAATNYRYDSAGLRVAEITGTTANETYYIRGLGGAVLAAYNGSGVARYHNILAPDGRVIGRREGSAKRLYVTDHLGTTRAVINETGTVVESRDYDPYGLEMNGRGWVSGAATKEGFTGHHYDRSTGLVYAGARYYLPGIGRWMAVDPLAEGYPGWSPYNYVLNNPLRYTDPTGECPVFSADCVNFTLGAARGAWSSVKGTASGMWNTVTDPVGTAKGLYHAATNPGETWEAVQGAVGERVDKVFSGDPIAQGEVLGELSVVVAEVVLGSKGFGALAKGTRAADTANDLGRASNAADGLRLQKSLASQAQMGEAGTIMPGPFRNAPRVAQQYGGSTPDWVKKYSSAYVAPDGRHIETHWVENVRTGQRVEFKTKIIPEGQ
jgi:RHS repeat-associated protein